MCVKMGRQFINQILFKRVHITGMSYADLVTEIVIRVTISELGDGELLYHTYP